ncbi:hypothetical protein ACERII_16460 [Evansella sp. AB-rgal1]|uniref:hypothetical protein n=1 Tax=Evansella sp. AB-rgal1 TaxID=3242696 RepID=UPI00359DD7DD
MIIFTKADENTLLDALVTSTLYGMSVSPRTPVVGSRVKARHHRTEPGWRHDAVAHRTWACT